MPFVFMCAPVKMAVLFMMTGSLQLACQKVAGVPLMRITLEDAVIPVALFRWWRPVRGAGGIKAANSCRYVRQLAASHRRAACACAPVLPVAI
jgi:hypothetical protein